MIQEDGIHVRRTAAHGRSDSSEETVNVMIGRIASSVFMCSILVIQLHGCPSFRLVSRVHRSAQVFN